MTSVRGLTIVQKIALEKKVFLFLSFSFYHLVFLIQVIVY